jgi:hypothetical protein
VRLTGLELLLPVGKEEFKLFSSRLHALAKCSTKSDAAFGTIEGLVHSRGCGDERTPGLRDSQEFPRDLVPASDLSNFPMLGHLCKAYRERHPKR